MLLTADRTTLPPEQFVEQHGHVFAVFGAATQDSGNVSYGVQAAGERLFVKTAGDPRDSRPLLSHKQRVELLRTAVRIARAISDPALPTLRNVVESSEGVLLVYDWVDGDLLGTSRPLRSDPQSAFCRFRALPSSQLVSALDAVLQLHLKLAELGWVACDFYDGCLIYDFREHRMHVVDLDTYRDAPFRNDMGRMFGSSRFMAPEEFQLGARIDERTTVFNLGRMIDQLFVSRNAGVEAVVRAACQPEPLRRYQSVSQLYAAWSASVQSAGANLAG
jgi:serine/threonine protein kinase